MGWARRCSSRRRLGRAIRLRRGTGTPLAGFGASLGDDHLLARPFQFRRKLGPQFIELTARPLQLDPPRLEPRLRRGVGLPLGCQFRLHAQAQCAPGAPSARA